MVFTVQNFSGEFKHATTEKIDSKAILITSNEPINVHTRIMENSTAEIACDLFYVLPEDRLARKYILVTNEMTPQFFFGRYRRKDNCGNQPRERESAF